MSENKVAESEEFSTVVTEYEPSKIRSDDYQTEAQLEASLIKQLQAQDYEYVNIHTEKDLLDNLRFQIEKLNDYQFSDSEWNSFYKKYISNPNLGIVEKTKSIQSDHRKVLIKDDGSTKNISLIDKIHLYKNKLQVINQYEEGKGNHNTRYDVTILVNGLPLVHIELKRRGIDLKEAFYQIDRYQRDSFWAGCGLYEFIQIFVISNGTFTKYYSNTTRNRSINQQTQSLKSRSKKTSNSFEFTSFWADSKNKTINDLEDFTHTFFVKHTLLSILTKYCVFNVENDLMVMRPYQIVATERILNCIEKAEKGNKNGTIGAGGYIWHTTGSGKTLTSFKTAQLACQFSYVDKVLFVVDRKDLDDQAIREYNRFQEKCVDANNNYKQLLERLSDPTKKIVVTTIQKLSHFILKTKQHEIYNKHIVFIFDECHRSQFGRMHSYIVKRYKDSETGNFLNLNHFTNYNLFGFTGTPIFVKNANRGNVAQATTQQVFGDRLHTYTIVDAIKDKNVLPFRLQFANTIKEKDDIKDEKISSIDKEKALTSPKRITEVVKYILEHFDQQTLRNTSYDVKGTRYSGFNSIFAVSSIPVLMKYYMEFKKQIQESGRDLVIATNFSYAKNEETINLDEQEIDHSLDGLDISARDFLDDAIDDYNKRFKTNYSTDGDSFDGYYKDLSRRVKNKEVDILLVVNMFLTGFDATTLNTLWVDKNLKEHGLIQAFSRTNRILNSVKNYGNIICFRNLTSEVKEAMALFGNKDAEGIILLRPFKDYYYGYTDDNGKRYEGYDECVKKLLDLYPIDKEIITIKDKKDFFKLYTYILRLTNILKCFDDFFGKEILTKRQVQDYKSLYIRIHEDLKGGKRQDKTDVSGDLVFEVELVKQFDISVDYILMQVQKYLTNNSKNKEVIVDVKASLNGSYELRSKRELIEDFIDKINTSTADIDVDVDVAFKEYVSDLKEKDINDLIHEENLKADETKDFFERAFKNEVLNISGSSVTNLLKNTPIFGLSKENSNGNSESFLDKLHRVNEKIEGLYNKFNGL